MIHERPSRLIAGVPEGVPLVARLEDPDAWAADGRPPSPPPFHLVIVFIRNVPVA
jgi:hypothetical protein